MIEELRTLLFASPILLNMQPFGDNLYEDNLAPRPVLSPHALPFHPLRQGGRARIA